LKEPILFTVSEASSFIGVSPRRVRQMCQERKLESRRPSPRRTRITKDSLVAYFATAQKTPIDPHGYITGDVAGARIAMLKRSSSSLPSPPPNL